MRNGDFNRSISHVSTTSHMTAHSADSSDSLNKVGSEICLTRIHSSKCQIINFINTPLGRRQRAYGTKRMINNEETVAVYIAAGRRVKRIVKQEKRNKELSIARICKHNPKSFHSYINERRIVRDNIGRLKTLERIVITTDNDIANIMNNYFSSVFTIEQLNNVPQLGQYEVIFFILQLQYWRSTGEAATFEHIQVHRTRYVSPTDSPCIRGQTC